MLNQLNKEAKKLLFFQGVFALGNGLSSLFVNVYLWRLNSSFIAIAMYNLMMYGALVIFSPVAGKVMQHKSVSACLRIGIMSYATFYAFILSLGDKAKEYFLLLGILMGIATAFHALGVNMFTLHVTHNKNRDFYLGFVGSVIGVSSIVIPPLSGWIITVYDSFLGYKLIFSITLILFVLSILITFWIKEERKEEVFEIKTLIHPYKQSKSWKYIIWATLLFGIREGTFSFIVNILLFIILKSEFTLGNYSMGMAIITLGSSYVIGRVLSKEKRVGYFLQGSIMLVISSIILVIWTNPIGLLVYCILDAIFKPFWNIPFNSISFEIIDELKEIYGSRINYIIAREFPLGIGRFIGLGFFIMMQNQLQNASVLKIVLPLLSCAYIGVFILLKGIQKLDFEKELKTIV